MSSPSVALILGVEPGVGGLGVQGLNAVQCLAAEGWTVKALTPRRRGPSDGQSTLTWHVGPVRPPAWLRVPLIRRWTGIAQHQADLRMGKWAATTVSRMDPSLVYSFTQVAREPLLWAQSRGRASVLESPNGHLRAFRQVYVEESRKWCDCGHRGHPTIQMVERVEEEYRLATAIRVSSEWSKQSLIAGGVPGEKIFVSQQQVDLARFHPRHRQQSGSDEPFRCVFVGSLDLRKGFPYLLRAMRLLKSRNFVLEVVGATGDRCSRAVFQRESSGLPVQLAPGNPVSALARADVFVLPTLEDGSPFAVAEAMAAGVPVITTDSNGSAEWIRPGHSGWVVPARNEEALAVALERALSARSSLREMGDVGRQDTELRANSAACARALSSQLRRFLPQ